MQPTPAATEVGGLIALASLWAENDSCLHLGKTEQGEHGSLVAKFEDMGERSVTVRIVGAVFIPLLSELCCKGK